MEAEYKKAELHDQGQQTLRRDNNTAIKKNLKRQQQKAMKQQVLFLLAFLAAAGLIDGLPAPVPERVDMESDSEDVDDDNYPHDIERRAVSPSKCKICS